MKTYYQKKTDKDFINQLDFLDMYDVSYRIKELKNEVKFLKAKITKLTKLYNQKLKQNNNI